MISRLFLASGATIAATAETGSMETIKNVLLIVFLVVGVAWLLIDARRNLITAYGGAEAPAPLPARAPTASYAPTPADRPSPEVLAVIAAAVHATIGRTSRIVAISTDDDDAQSWAAEGRRAIYATRKVR
jgi:Na+-transporting methylmalonyl-CoA/oxaloacetate decarboxylase gamma subunit